MKEDKTVSINRMKELISELNKASESYYRNNTSIMTDFEYDRLFDELVELEKDTNTVLSNSPSINIEPEVASYLEKVDHPSPMLSLSKTKSIDDLVSFIEDKDGLLSWKLDGLTIVLTYNDGKLVSGVTRGNGIVGEVVTDNVKRFKNIPLSIPYKGKLVVRGEAIIKYSDFKKMNDDSDEANQYKNPRNLCSGSVRQLDSSVTAERNVYCVIFSLIESSDIISNYKSECFNWLEKQGFDVVEHEYVDKDNIEEVVLNYKKKILKYDIPSDGLVLTFNDTNYGNSLGATAKSPKHSIAFKWKDETEKSILESVDWMVSRTGLINPVAVFTPVELEGTIVSRASLHNVSILQGLKLGIGDEILVYKANMIIPQIAGNNTNSNTLEIPNKCPVCKHEARIIENSDIKYLYCMNEFCVAKLMKKLSLFTSRNAMNIDGISDAILNKLIDEKIIKSYKDLYDLDKHKETIMDFEGFGEKSFNNLMNSINKSKKVKLANFIYSLGIPDIGLSRAKLICKSFSNDIDHIKKLTFEELSEIVGVGSVIAEEWITTFNKEEFINEFNELVKIISITDINKTTNNRLIDKVFVITGNVLEFSNRDEMIEYIEYYGGKVISAISSKVDYLINNDIHSTSTKNKKAKELNIQIISEKDLMNMCKER